MRTQLKRRACHAGAPTGSLGLPQKEEALAITPLSAGALLEGQEFSRWPSHTWCRGSPWPSQVPCTPNTGGPPPQGHPGSLQQEVRGCPEPHPQRVAAQRQPVPRQSLQGPLVLRQSCWCPGGAAAGGTEQYALSSPSQCVARGQASTPPLSPLPPWVAEPTSGA